MRSSFVRTSATCMSTATLRGSTAADCWPIAARCSAPMAIRKVWAHSRSESQVQADFCTGALRPIASVGFDTQNSDAGAEIRLQLRRSIDPMCSGRYMASTSVNPLLGADRFNQNQYGLYAQDQIKFDRFVLTLGAREDWATRQGARLPARCQDSSARDASELPRAA